MKLRIKRSATIFAVAALLAADCALAQQVDLGRGSVVQTVARLRPGEYVWAPNIAPKGPALLIVSLATQRAILFRNGVPIAASTVSTGRPGYETPTGVFTILQKQVEHYSRTYDNAPMPYMQRLTWRGVAVHAGKLPGYPASHGCIRLPAGFARRLFGVTKLGMTVAITDQAATPRVAPTPEIALARPNDRTGPAAVVEWHPERSASGPVSIIISAADNRAIVIRNGIQIGSAPVTVEGPIAGSWAYALRSIDGSKQNWIRIDLGAGGSSQEVEPQEWRRFQAPEEFKRAVRGIVAPGMTIVVTADSLRAGEAGTALTVMESAPSAKP